MASNEQLEVTPGQELRSGRAQAVTRLHYQMARQIAGEIDSAALLSPSSPLVLALLQAISTNYLATITSSK